MALDDIQTGLDNVQSKLNRIESHLEKIADAADTFKIAGHMIFFFLALFGLMDKDLNIFFRGLCLLSVSVITIHCLLGLIKIFR